MPTGPVNSESTSKSLRVPHSLADKIEQIAEREHRSFAATMVEIIRANIDHYDERSKKHYEDLAGEAKKEDRGNQEPAEEVKDKQGVKKKPKESAS